MKKMLLTMCIAGGSLLGYSQSFTPGNLVVVQANVDNGLPTISLREYTRSGVPGVRVNIDSTGTNSTVLSNKTGGATFEGFLNLSPDYLTLGLVGYNLAHTETVSPVSAGANASAPRVILKVNADGDVTYVKAPLTSSTYTRAVALAAGANDAWVIGASTNYIKYVDVSDPNANPGTVNVTTAAAGYTVKIYNGKLYFSSNASGKNGINDVANIAPDNLLPKNGTNATNLIIPSPANIVLDFVIFDADGTNNLAYLGTHSTGATDAAIYKYYYNGTAWEAKGSVAIPIDIIASGSQNRRIQGLTGHKTIDGKYALYASTFSNVLKVIDTAAPNEDMTGTMSNIAEAPANTLFRGIAFTPGSTPAVLLPVELKSFTGKAEGEAIRLNWSTASEKNNSHFEVLRSASSAPSEVIGREEGNGDSNSVNNYSFEDANPYPGTNYYQLKQVDKDGKSSKSNVIVVKSNVKATALSVSSANGEEVLVHVNAANSASGSITVSDILGNKLAEVKVSLEKGYNKVAVSTPGITPGVYVVTLNSAGKKLTAKFVK